MRAEDILKSFKKRFGKKIPEAEIEKDGKTLKRVWLRVGRDLFRDCVKHLVGTYSTRFAVCSGYDAGESIELIYHFFVFSEKPGDVSVNIRVSIPKHDPTIQTITDIIPGSLISERELQEMLGVRIEGIPDPRRLFLPGDFPEGIYPWRRDEHGPEKLIRDMHKEGKT